MTTAPGQKRPRILHVITGLSVGGAETMLLKLLSAVPDVASRCTVVALSDDRPLGDDIRALGVPVHRLGLRPATAPAGLLRLKQLIQQVGPDIVQTWMYHSDLIGGIAARMAGRPVLWGIRSSFDRGTSHRGTRLVARLNARLSRVVPTAIVSCSTAAGAMHAKLGYDAGRIRVIPNGFDLARFRPDPAARAALRSELHIAADAPVLGYVARFDAQKDHRGFLAAARTLAAAAPAVQFVLCGAGIDRGNDRLQHWIAEAGVAGRTHLLGLRRDVERVIPAFDVATMASAYAEGFPNAIGEAMACGVPCVVTDVGDSGMIVGDTGLVVPPLAPDALAAAWGRMIGLPADERRRLGAAARTRIETEFSLAAVAQRFEQLYEDVIADVRHHRTS